MSYCPKCGAKIEDGDLFCYSCGYKVGNGEVPEGAVSNQQYVEQYSAKPVIDYEKNKELTHPLAKAGFIMSIISLGLTALGFIGAILAYNSMLEGLYKLSSTIFYLGLLGGAVSLGLAIPGFVLTKKKGFKQTIAIAGLVLAIIAVALLIVYYVYDEYYLNN